MKKGYSIILRKTGAGHYEVDIMKDFEELGNFQTTNMGLIDDIQEMKNDGFEHELINHDTFEEVLETCLNQLSK